MLRLDDLTHLPLLDPLIEEIVADRSGLVVVAGLDPRPVGINVESGFLPSGRAAIWRILLRQYLDVHPRWRVSLVTTDPETLRVPRAWRRRVQVFRPDLGMNPLPGASPSLKVISTSQVSYQEAIARAVGGRPDLLAVDEMTRDTAAAALEVAASGVRVVSQLDTVLRGADAAQHLLDLCEHRDLLKGLRWILAVQRLPTLCTRCKKPEAVDAALLDEWESRYPALDATLRAGTYFRSGGCTHCRGTGREGEITAFDVFEAGDDPLDGASRLPLEAYMLALAAAGHLAPDDYRRFETEQLRRTYHLLATSERALTAAKADLERRLTEIEAANRVLQQRTEALVALEGIGQALITSADLRELAGRLCRHARELCGADRAILYYLPPTGAAGEVLGVSGWDAELVGKLLPTESLADLLLPRGEPVPYNRIPPGIAVMDPDVMGIALHTGLRVPLVAHERTVGLMIVNSSRRARFAPGEVALLQAFANHAALAIQRAGLVESLQDKIVQLEAAQVELVQKERMERELELARQLQQSVLPKVFPLIPGYAFAGRSRAARWVGGDFYDVIPLDAGRFALVVGDVSDKGMRAALYMAQTHSLFRAESRRETSPREVLYRVHHLLQELSRAEMFVTVFYGVVDARERRLRYARAGHDLPLLVRGGQVRPLGGEGVVLGFPGIDDLNLTEEEILLQPGDRLILYSDGVTDARGADDAAFGKERLIELLAASAALPAGEMCDATFKRLAAYQGSVEAYDDATMLVVEVK
ncbi:MAG TPA: SpoIIE family protein phosphatase [Anaerolineae bacterium]|nr:SpoIIE family protein phosphatase [Anaerolineae bacterium]